jgi:MFS superfamily sulfate permease-like transporter
VIYRFPGALFFANSGHFRSRVEELTQAAEKDGTHTLILDASMIIGTDITACDALKEVIEELRGRGIRFVLAQVRANVRGTFERGDVIEALGEDSIFHTIEEAVDSGGSESSALSAKS